MKLRPPFFKILFYNRHPTIRWYIDRFYFSLLSRQKQIQVHWDNTGWGWEYLTPPWRPSVGDITIYKDSIRKYSGLPQRVLILGATPELRDLLGRQKISYIVVDQSWKMIIGMVRFLKKANPKDEVWLRADWEKLPFPEGYFDLILGDMVFGQLLPKEQDRFLVKISSLLKKSSVFITRVHVVSKTDTRDNFFSLIQEVFDHGNWNEYQKANIIGSKLLDASGDFKTGLTNRAWVMNALRFYQPRTPLEKKVIDRLMIRWSSLKLEYSFQSEATIIKKFLRYFEIISKCHSTDYEDSELYPILVAKPR